MRITVLTSSVLVSCHGLGSFPGNIDELVLFKYISPSWFSSLTAPMCKIGQVTTIIVCDLGINRTQLANQPHTVFITNGCMPVETSYILVYDTCICKSHVYLNSSTT